MLIYVLFAYEGKDIVRQTDPIETKNWLSLKQSNFLIFRKHIAIRNSL